MALLKEIQHHIELSNVSRKCNQQEWTLHEIWLWCNIITKLVIFRGEINIHTTPHCFMILSLHYYNNEWNFSGNNFFISLRAFTLRRVSIPVKLSVQHHYLDIFNPSHKIKPFQNPVGSICF
jgi:hypothetical protein